MWYFDGIAWWKSHGNQTCTVRTCNNSVGCLNGVTKINKLGFIEIFKNKFGLNALRGGGAKVRFYCIFNIAEMLISKTNCYVTNQPKKMKIFIKCLIKWEMIKEFRWFHRHFLTVPHCSCLWLHHTKGEPWISLMKANTPRF